MNFRRALDVARLRAQIPQEDSMEAPGFQTIGLTMSQWELDFSFSFGF